MSNPCRPQRTVPGRFPHLASGAPNWSQQRTRTWKRKNMAGRQLCWQEGHSLSPWGALSLQLTVHVHQGLTAFGQKLLLLPLRPNSFLAVFRRLWPALKSLLPPPHAGPHQPNASSRFLFPCFPSCLPFRLPGLLKSQSRGQFQHLIGWRRGQPTGVSTMTN